MGLFGLLKIEDHLLTMLVNSKFARDGLTTVTTYLITALVRLHISAVVCSLIYFNNWFDYVFPILVGVGLITISNTLFQYIETHEESWEYWVNYFIDEYSEKNFIRWKRNFQLVLCVYVFILLLLTEITNYLIFVWTVQAMIISLIGDLIEQKIPQRYINNWWYYPRVTKLGELVIHENYKEPITELQPIPPRLPKVPSVTSMANIPINQIPEIPPKPPTPPMLRKR